MSQIRAEKAIHNLTCLQTVLNRSRGIANASLLSCTTGGACIPGTVETLDSDVEQTIDSATSGKHQCDVVGLNENRGG